MNINNIITKQELWNLPNEQISKLTKGRLIRILLTNGEPKEVVVKNLLAATNTPHLFTGFLTMEDKVINITNIVQIELNKEMYEKGI